MKRLWSRLHSTSLPALILIAVIFAVGMTMWALGPTEGNKYSDLGINLGVGAVRRGGPVRRGTGGSDRGGT
jgi:hypothetical protein